MDKILSLFSRREDRNKKMSSIFRKIWKQISEGLSGYFMSQ